MAFHYLLQTSSARPFSKVLKTWCMMLSVVLARVSICINNSIVIVAAAAQGHDVVGTDHCPAEVEKAKNFINDSFNVPKCNWKTDVSVEKMVPSLCCEDYFYVCEQPDVVLGDLLEESGDQVKFAWPGQAFSNRETRRVKLAKSI
jgi:hypothetical protein